MPIKLCTSLLVLACSLLILKQSFATLERPSKQQIDKNDAGKSQIESPVSAKTRDCSPTEEKWWNELRDQGLQIRRLQSEEGPLNSELYNRQQGHTGSTDEAKQLQSKVDAIEKDLEQHKTGFRNLLKIGAEKNYNVPIGDQRLTLIWQARPNYTEQARINNITGAVSVMAAFEANGNVSHCKVIQGLGFGLDENAVDALQRVLFLPEIQNGHFVSVFHRVKLNFVLM